MEKMPQEHLVTVIVVAYNHGQTIAHCLDSILEQQTSFPFIIDIAEDASSDNTQEVCARYAAMYPEKIRYFPQEKNIGAEKNFRRALKRMNSQYWIETDGDDYWCDREKLALSVKILEENSDVTAVAHNVRQHNLMTKSDDLLMGETRNLYNGKIIDKNKVRYYFTDGFYFHISSRLCRNIIDFSDEKHDVGDTFMMYLFLDKGPTYYIDRVMSVYNISGKGSNSSLTQEQRDQSYLNLINRMNTFFDYKYDSFFQPSIQANNNSFLCKINRVLNRAPIIKNNARKIYFKLINKKQYSSKKDLS